MPPPVVVQTSSFLASNMDPGAGDSASSDGGGLRPADKLFQAEHANVQMAFNVYQTAVEEGVRRVIVRPLPSPPQHPYHRPLRRPSVTMPPHHLQVGSSNHAADYWEPLILDRECDTLTEDHARSDNYYGWAKIACEHFLPALPAFAPRYRPSALL